MGWRRLKAVAAGWDARDDTRAPTPFVAGPFDKLRRAAGSARRLLELRFPCSISHGSHRAARMLFNSYEYLIYFLPLALAAYFVLGRKATWAVGSLVAASLFFYSWWSPKHLPLILASIGFNFAIGPALHRVPKPVLSRA